MATMKLLIALALVVCAYGARMPDLRVIEEDLPESVVAFQGGASSVQHGDHDLGLPELEGVGGYAHRLHVCVLTVLACRQ